MADLVDVENALVALISQTVYPNGTLLPSVAAIPVKVYAGWPAAAQLDADLRAGIANVSVFPTDSEQNTTRYPKGWQTVSLNPPTLTLAVNAQSVTVGGTVSTPCNLALLVSGKNYVYAVQAADTRASIATALASLLVIDFPGTASAGDVITLPLAARIAAAKVGATGTSMRELRRQERVFQITAWCDTPQHRDAVAQPVDVALAATQFLTLADGTAARLVYKGSPVTDAAQKARLYRRDLLYTVEYATTQTVQSTQVVAAQQNLSNQPSGAQVALGIITINQ